MEIFLCLDQKSPQEHTAKVRLSAGVGAVAARRTAKYPKTRRSTIQQSASS